MGMNKKVLLSAFSALLLLVSGGIVYKNFPAIVSTVYEHKSFKEANLKLKKIKVNNEIFAYAEGGTGPNLLFVHGFQGDKRSWVRYAKHFVSSYHVVIPDLPAHGDSTYKSDQRFDLESLSYVLDEFVREKKLDKFTIIGTSLGAGVSMKYSLLFPQKVEKMVLLNPIGIRPSDEDQFIQVKKTNQRMFFPTTIKELDDLYVYLMGHPLPYRLQFKEYILSLLLEKRKIYQKVYFDLVSGEGIEKELTKINVPTLMITGKYDKVSRLEDFKVYSKTIPNCSAILLEDGYHIFQGTAFDSAINHMDEFFKR